MLLINLFGNDHLLNCNPHPVAGITMCTAFFNLFNTKPSHMSEGPQIDNSPPTLEVWKVPNFSSIPNWAFKIFLNIAVFFYCLATQLFVAGTSK